MTILLDPVRKTHWVKCDYGVRGGTAMGVKPLSLGTSGILQNFLLRGYQQEILAVLDEDASLVDVLQDVDHELKRRLGECQLYLEFVCHPDSSDDEQLVISVQPLDPNAESAAKFEQFEEDYWLDALHRANGRLLVVLEA